jgi:hypothetical protein
MASALRTISSTTIALGVSTVVLLIAIQHQLSEVAGLGTLTDFVNYQFR